MPDLGILMLRRQLNGQPKLPKRHTKGKKAKTRQAKVAHAETAPVRSRDIHSVQ